MQVKKMIKTLPGIRGLCNRLSQIEDKLNILEYENTLLGQQMVDIRLALKGTGNGAINVVFVCHRPEVWGALKTVYEAMMRDSHFNVKIVAIPNKKEIAGKGLNHEIYESEGAEEFWKEYGCIEGFNYENKTWLDLRSLKPDYIFFQQPYNITRCPEYKSWIVSKYAKLCYITYYSPLYGDEICYIDCLPEDYIKNVSFIFAHNEFDYKLLCERFKMIGNNIVCIENTGYPRYDSVKKFLNQKSKIWQGNNSFKIIWTPRWTLNEGNCNFFEYKDNFLELCRTNSQFELVFRPHPQAFLEWRATGKIDESEESMIRESFNQDNIHLDESKDYFPLLYSSDCLITDRSSIFLDYFCTGKPIIYCQGKNNSGLFPEYEKGLYIVDNWKELIDVLLELYNGNDPLKNIREQIVKDYLLPKGKSAGEKIAEIILNDAIAHKERRLDV